jgi:hypothetical protein
MSDLTLRNCCESPIGVVSIVPTIPEKMSDYRSLRNADSVIRETLSFLGKLNKGGFLACRNFEIRA